MKRIFLLALTLVCGLAYGNANDMVFTKRNTANTGQNSVVYSSPASPGLLIYDPSIADVSYATLGSNVTFTGGVLNVSTTVGAQGATGAPGATGSTGATGATGAAGSNATVTAYVGTTLKTSVLSIFKSATVASGVATFYLTADGTATGAALFANEVFVESVNTNVNDATASYQMAWAFSNSNKTLAVTVNKLGTASLLTGILGQVAAPNGTAVYLQIKGR